MGHGRSNTDRWEKGFAALSKFLAREWPAPGSEDTELGVFMEPEVSDGKTKVHTRVQA